MLHSDKENGDPGDSVGVCSNGSIRRVLRYLLQSCESSPSHDGDAIDPQDEEGGHRDELCFRLDPPWTLPLSPLCSLAPAASASLSWCRTELDGLDESKSCEGRRCSRSVIERREHSCADVGGRRSEEEEEEMR